MSKRNDQNTTVIKDADLKEFGSMAKHQPSFSDIKSVCPDIKVDDMGQIVPGTGKVKGRKNVLALREMYGNQNEAKIGREMRVASKSEWMQLRSKDGRKKEVRARSAEKAAKKLGMHEVPYWGTAVETTVYGRTEIRHFKRNQAGDMVLSGVEKKVGNEWVTQEAQ